MEQRKKKKKKKYSEKTKKYKKKESRTTVQLNRDMKFIFSLSRPKLSISLMRSTIADTHTTTHTDTHRFSCFAFRFSHPIHLLSPHFSLSVSLSVTLSQSVVPLLFPSPTQFCVYCSCHLTIRLNQHLLDISFNIQFHNHNSVLLIRW